MFENQRLKCLQAVREWNKDSFLVSRRTWYKKSEQGNFAEAFCSDTRQTNMKVVLKVAVAFIPILVVFLWFASPSIWYVIQTDRWEAEIKRNQNPEELRAWALDLVAKYGSRSNDKVTNRPPSTIPQSHEYPMSVFVQSSLVPDDPSGQSYTSHVVLMCGSGFLPGWGMDVGYTNFVSTHLNAEAWVPGIYFFWENH